MKCEIRTDCSKLDIDNVLCEVIFCVENHSIANPIVTANQQRVTQKLFLGLSFCAEISSFWISNHIDMQANQQHQLIVSAQKMHDHKYRQNQ